MRIGKSALRDSSEFQLLLVVRWWDVGKHQKGADHPDDPNFFGSRPLRRFQMTKVTDSGSEVSVTMGHLAERSGDARSCSHGEKEGL
jgi:hypothetical protein